MSSDEKLIKILKALSSSPRLEILDYLKHGAASPIEVARDLKRNPSTIEQHLKILFEAEVIRKNVNDKKHITYSSRKEGLDLLEIIRKFINDNQLEVV